MNTTQFAISGKNRKALKNKLKQLEETLSEAYTDHPDLKQVDNLKKQIATIKNNLEKKTEQPFVRENKKQQNQK